MKQASKFLSLTGALSLLTPALCAAPKPDSPLKARHADAAKAAPLARILSASAKSRNKATLLEIVLSEARKATLKLSGTHLALTLPDCLPDALLGGQMESGGAVARLGLQAPKATEHAAILTAELRGAATAEMIPGPDSKTILIRIVEDEAPAASRLIRPDAEAGLYDIDAAQSSLPELLKSLAKNEGVSVALTASVTGKASISLRKGTFLQALDLLTKSAGLGYHQSGATFFIGTPKEIEAAYPAPQIEAPRPIAPVMAQEVYRCGHISAAELVASLVTMFDKDLRIGLGASFITPHLESGNSGTVTGVQASVIKSDAVGPTSSLASRDVILFGEESVVKRALALAAKLDRRRRQVKIDVKIVDMSLDDEKQLGVQWTLPSAYSVVETAGAAAATGGASASSSLISGLNFGTFAHNPISATAAPAAKQTRANSKVLAAPNMTMLDGEKGFILIGQRLQYPKLISNSAVQGPQYDVAEERVGIYMQVAAQIADDGEITLSLYPQISTVTSYATFSGGSYPQISTREQQTTIRVRSGAQIIIGGLLRDDEIKNIEKVPFLANLPFFGELFTYRKTSHIKSDVVIMLRPQLLED